jgi:hypothetical protein
MHEIEQGLARDWVEVVAAVLLALATVASAWSAYQAAAWSGVESTKFSLSQAARTQAAEADEKADSQNAVDIFLFSSYADAFARGDVRLVEYYETSLFRDEMKPALEAWKATRPLTNPQAPKNPFVMPEYKLAEAEKASELETRANKESLKARNAIEKSDRYVLFTVLFASVLFFAGISTKFRANGIRLSVLLMGTVLFLGTFVAVILQPIA